MEISHKNLAFHYCIVIKSPLKGQKKDHSFFYFDLSGHLLIYLFYRYLLFANNFKWKWKNF